MTTHEKQQRSKMEREANAFALCLLIPKEMIMADLEKEPLKSADDGQMQALAKKYGVSLTAMVCRISILPKSFKKKIGWL